VTYHRTFVQSRLQTFFDGSNAHPLRAFCARGTTMFRSTRLIAAQRLLLGPIFNNTGGLCLPRAAVQLPIASFACSMQLELALPGVVILSCKALALQVPWLGISFPSCMIAAWFCAMFHGRSTVSWEVRCMPSVCGPSTSCTSIRCEFLGQFDHRVHGVFDGLKAGALHHSEAQLTSCEFSRNAARLSREHHKPVVCVRMYQSGVGKMLFSSCNHCYGRIIGRI